MNAAATQRLMIELRHIREGQTAIVDRLDTLIALQEKPPPKKRARKTPPKPKASET